MVLGSTQPLTEMSTRSISWRQKRPMRKADNLTTVLCRCYDIWEPLLPGTLWATRPVMGLFYLLPLPVKWERKANICYLKQLQWPSSTSLSFKVILGHDELSQTHWITHLLFECNFEFLMSYTTVLYHLRHYAALNETRCSLYVINWKLLWRKQQTWMITLKQT